MAFSVALLGPFAISSDDRRIVKLPKKARALIAYLAAQGGQAISRERLADLLWPYQESEQARHSLRNCLLELRKALGSIAAHHLVGEFTHCQLRDVRVDLDDFEQLSRSSQRSDLQAAADLYRGEFLADFHITSEPFQEWLAAERDRTLAVACDTLHRLAAAREAAGEHDAAIQSARRLVLLDPLSEIGQRALIRAYARAGRRGEALRQYKSCAATLQRELGVTPDDETQALANEIVRRGVALEPDAAAGTIANSGAALVQAGSSRSPLGRGGGHPIPVPDTRSGKSRWPCFLPRIAVAVAPMRNLTGDLDQQFLVEAFTDNLSTDLLRRGRGFSLKPLTEEQASPANFALASGAEQESIYLVTGSAQRSNPGKLRVNMRISDVATREYLWAGRQEFQPEDLTAIQTKITRRISRELHSLLLRTASRCAVAEAGELGVAECLSRAAHAMAQGMRSELSAEAQRWYLTALASDPRNVEALTGLAWTCQHLASNPWWGEPQAAAAASDLGREAAAIALSIAPGHAGALCVQGTLYSAAGQLQEAERAFKQALAMDQALGIAHGFAGYNAAFLGRADETMPAIQRALRLDQADRRHSVWFFFGGFAELLLGRTDTSIGLLNKSLERNPSYGSPQLFLMAALSLLGRRSDAERTAATFRAQYPEYRANVFEQLWLSRSESATYRAQIHPLFEKIRSLGVAH
jgi:DNA-binding SARP family transcriptional activator/TolB-like protein/Tfp pilus assembly protein PilF